MFDLSALDAELDGLGRAPENVTSLAQGFAGIALSGSLSAQLEQADRELSALSNGEYRIPSAPSHEPSGVVPVLHALQPELLSESLPPEPALEVESFQHTPSRTHSASLTQSQEIVLPDPIAREELSSESGELRLGGSDPESGSFELPDSPTEPRILQDDEALAGDSSSDALIPFDDVQDALEGSQPIAVMTMGRATVSPSHDLDRDPDAEFDALLSEATDPRGIPTDGAQNEVDTDDLLRGLEGGDLSEEVSLEELEDDEAPHEADALTRSLYEDSGDNTDILDRDALTALEGLAAGTDTSRDHSRAEESASLAALMTPDELDSGELEILDDEPTLAPQPMPLKASSAPAKPPLPKSPTARPGLSNKAPPPPPPSGKPDKRPSGGLLGRLFTKREGE